MKITPGSCLSKINSPEDVKKLDEKQLLLLCDELRQFIIDNVSVNGGHFGASLGVVELTVALHHVFDIGQDPLIWDVGHQAYAHKIITGRRDVFHTNRKYKGISGFPKRSESKYDAFGVGHSSTSISAALGMAIASSFEKDSKRHHIAVIGDGALTGGMAFEAMNHAGVAKNANLLIIINDNCMSIDPNVGALKNYLTKISTSSIFNQFRDEAWNILGKIGKYSPNAREMASQIESSLKSLFLHQSNLFESLNLRYFGPVDGHNVQHVSKVLRDLKKISGPKILHCLTVKGKGFKKAEEDQTKWHAPGSFDKMTGKIYKQPTEGPQAPKYQDVFGKTLLSLAQSDPTIMGITPAMPSGSSMNIMQKEMPHRTFDVGIAEQHAVTFSAGLATQGLTPFCHIYSTFIQRAYDQVIHDVCIQNLSVIFCLDRAGMSGADGATHHGAYDLAFMRCLPNMVVSAPMDEIELRNLMFTASVYKKGPFSIRYPRGKGVHPDWEKKLEKIPIGKGRELTKGEELAVLSIGHIGNHVQKAIQKLQHKGYSVGHYDMRFVKPLDQDLLKKIMTQYSYIICVEDGCLQGGFGSAVLEFMSENNFQIPVKRLGIPDQFIEQGTQQELYASCGYDEEKIYQSALNILKKYYLSI